MPSSPILIIGAGLGGLLLAQGLKKANIPFRIFERDATSSWRAQGYRIRISSQGIEALEYALPADLWVHFEKTCATIKLGGFTVNAFSASASTEHPTRPDGSLPHGPRRPYTADRTTLRTLLLTGLDEHISFGKEFSHYETTAAGVVAYFTDGSTADGTLLVGADGLRSRIRKQFLPSHKPVDTDGRVIYGKTPLTAEVLERMPAGSLERMLLVEDTSHDGVPLMMLYEPIRFPQREEVAGLPQDYVYWVLISRRAMFGVSDETLLRMSNEEAARLALKVTEKWNPALRPILLLQDVSQTSALRVTSMRPNIAEWAPSERVTLIGDAVHVMSPSGGIGAVTAFRDAANLAKVLAEDGVSAASIGKYEQMMRTYAGEAIQGSYRGGVRFFNHPPFEECETVDV